MLQPERDATTHNRAEFLGTAEYVLTYNEWKTDFRDTVTQWFNCYKLES